MKIALITKPLEIVYKAVVNPDTKKYDGETYVLLTPISINVNDTTVTIPRGFVTDLGSIPRIFRGLVDNDDKSTLGFIVHDWVGKKGSLPKGFNRHAADRLLFHVSRLCGQNIYRAAMTYLGTRVGGLFYYRKHNPIIIPEEELYTVVKPASPSPS